MIIYDDLITKGKLTEEDRKKIMKWYKYYKSYIEEQKEGGSIDQNEN